MPLSSSTMGVGAVSKELKSIQDARPGDTGSKIHNTPDATYHPKKK